MSEWSGLSPSAGRASLRDPMSYCAQILADSLSPAGQRLTTLEVTFPRMVLAEFNTHRVFSRNSASSRAIPVKKQLQRVLAAPFVPREFGANQPGMQAGAPLSGAQAQAAEREWLSARDSAVAHVLRLLVNPHVCAADADAVTLAGVVEDVSMTDPGEDWLNVHKQLANRLLEPFMWHTLIVTSTEWSNFFHLRAHADAQPEIRDIAELMRKAYEVSEPVPVADGEWHLPLITDGDAELSDEDRVKVCVGRCARVSYLTHDGRRDPAADLILYDRLWAGGHLSPFEHVARPSAGDEWHGNFRGWRAHRQDLPNEADPLAPARDVLAVS
jgi:hypothetical protein